GFVLYPVASSGNNASCHWIKASFFIQWQLALLPELACLCYGDRTNTIGPFHPRIKDDARTSAAFFTARRRLFPALREASGEYSEGRSGALRHAFALYCGERAGTEH